MKRWVKLTDKLTVDPELIAAVVTRSAYIDSQGIVYSASRDRTICLVPVMAATDAQWLVVETLKPLCVDTYKTPEMWNGEPIERTYMVFEDDEPFLARIQQRVDAITAALANDTRND